MKKIFLWGAFALLTTTAISCTSDDYEDAQQKANTAKPTFADGPGDAPIPVPPPKKPE